MCHCAALQGEIDKSDIFHVTQHTNVIIRIVGDKIAGRRALRIQQNT